MFLPSFLFASGFLLFNMFFLQCPPQQNMAELLVILNKCNWDSIFLLQRSLRRRELPTGLNGCQSRGMCCDVRIIEESLQRPVLIRSYEDLYDPVYVASDSGHCKRVFCNCECTLQVFKTTERSSNKDNMHIFLHSSRLRVKYLY